MVCRKDLGQFAKIQLKQQLDTTKSGSDNEPAFLWELAPKSKVQSETESIQDIHHPG